MKNKIPKWVRCYDDDGIYTVIFSKELITGLHYYLIMSEHPYHPQGLFVSGASEKPRYKGKKITFDMLPEDCKNKVAEMYDGIREFLINKIRK